jgi:hypothetical protein
VDQASELLGVGVGKGLQLEGELAVLLSMMVFRVDGGAVTRG